MGFIQAVAEVGALDYKPGLESYLKFPLENRGKIIRVFLDIEDLNAERLVIKGVIRIDVADQLSDPEMKKRYLYRNKVGANVSWGFNPMHKLGKPKADRDANAKIWSGSTGNWKTDDKSHLYKIRKRVLSDYEAEGFIAKGSSELIMQGMEEQLDSILDAFQARESHVIIFGGEQEGAFVYPGDIPAFVKYFAMKLERTLQSDAQVAKACSLCGHDSDNRTALSSVFKFATMDKVNFLPGLNSKQEKSMFAVCPVCLEKVSAGRERVERTLTSNDLIPGLSLWIIPETVGIDGSDAIRDAVFRLEQLWDEKELQTPGEKGEKRMLQKMAREGKGLIFHFIFWERNNAQELIHLMVEDVPPERLAFLARKWEQAFKSVAGNNVASGLNLDWAMKSLYATLSSFAGKSKGDKLVFRDYALKVLGKLLRGERLPVRTFKQIIVSRSARVIFENENWSEVQRNFLYARVWVEYMNLIDRG